MIDKDEKDTDVKKTSWLNDRRTLHAIALLVIVLVSTLLFYKHFTTRGMLMHVDMTFPTTISRNIALYSHAWWQYGSVQNIWNLQRIFWTSPLLAIVKLLHISTDRYLLIMFVGTFALAGVSMYALAFHTIKRLKIAGTNMYAPYVGAAFAGVLFMYNPFSVSHLWPYFGYPGYAVLPLAFLLLIKTIDAPRAWKVILLALLISVAGTGPINVVWYWFMILGYLIFYLIISRFSRKSLATTGKIVAPLAGIYVLLNTMWIMPYTGSQLVNKPFTPSYINGFSRSMLDMLSKSGTLLNNMRLTTGWGMPVSPAPRGTLWIVLSFAMPVLALVAILVLWRKVRRDRLVMFWSIMFLLSVLLATGTSFVIARYYSWFILKAPGVSALGWVFRAADRWLVFAAVFYALMLGLLVAYLLRDRKTAQGLAGCAIMAVVLISFAPKTISYAKTVYNPTQIPSDYAQVEDYILSKPAPARPVWVPFARDGFRYDWAREKRIGPFDVYTSNASLNNLQNIFNQDNFYYWLESLYSPTYLYPGEVLNKQVILKDDVVSKLLMPFASQYVVYDSTIPGYSLKAMREDKSLKSVYKTNMLEVLKQNASAQVLRPATGTLRIDNYYDELAVAQRLSADEVKQISFVARNTNVDKRFGVVDMNDYKQYYDINSGFEDTKFGGLPQKWTLGGTINPFKGTLPSYAWDILNGGKSPSFAVDTKTKASGRQSFKVVNPYKQDLSIYSILGQEIPVKQGEIYNLSSKIKYENADWTNVSVFGFETASETWVRLASAPPIQSGTSGWKKTDCSFYMPAGISSIRPVLGAGWARAGNKPATSWFDDIRLSKISDKLYSDLDGSRTPPELSFKQLSPEKYQVQVKGATDPFVLVFSETFDPLWVAHVENGKDIDPIMVYSTVNGFPLHKKGDFKMTIEYVPQGWFVQGLVVSLAVLILCLLYLCFTLIRWKFPPRGRLGIEP